MSFPFANTAIAVTAHNASHAHPLHHQAASSHRGGTVFHWLQKLNVAFAVQYWLSFSGSWRQAELLFIDLLSVSSSVQ